jgi:hypothetical protein
MTLCFLSAYLANWLKPYRGACYFSTMYNLMTVNAKRNAVTDFIAQVREVFPRLDVVGVYLSSCAAFLAGEPISLINGSTPFLVFVTSAMLVLIGLYRRLVSAFLRAILLLVAATDKKSSAQFAREFFSGVEFSGAFGGACFSCSPMLIYKHLSANHALNSTALVAVVLTTVKRVELCAAIFTGYSYNG